MTASATLARAEAAGLRFRLDGSRVRMEADRPPRADLLADLRRHREEVAHLLTLREAVRGHEAVATDPTAGYGGQDPDEAAAMATHHATPASPSPYTPATADALRDGLLIGARKRLTSFPLGQIPRPGDWCGCCRFGRWWREEVEAKGWRCRTCHPPPPGVAAVEERTDRLAAGATP